MSQTEIQQRSKVVFLTAGAAGMYCGSCMHDNALAKAMRRIEIDCLLQPVYTPIRTDEESIAGENVFFGGIHIYLLQRFPWLRILPARLLRTLDWAPLLRLATSRTHSTDAAELGALAVSMLRGTDGNQASEVRRLVSWMTDNIQPNAVLLTNLLIGGALPQLRERLPQARLVVLLQGDDIFLDHLPHPYRHQAIERCQALVPYVDRFVLNSQFYAEKMGKLLNIPAAKQIITPLSIDTAPLESAWNVGKTRSGNLRLGYLARIAPEKGLHNLVDAFIKLAKQNKQVTLHAAGWLGENNRGYLQQQQHKLAAAGLQDRFEYHGSPSLEEKVRYLKTLDVFSVPTDYHEPKGLFVLEALAAGVPVVQPDHGAFAELIRATGGGLTFRPGCVDSLSETITRLLSDHPLRRTLANTGRDRVLANHSITIAAQRMKEILFC